MNLNWLLVFHITCSARMLVTRMLVARNSLTNFLRCRHLSPQFGPLLTSAGNLRKYVTKSHSEIEFLGSDSGSSALGTVSSEFSAQAGSALKDAMAGGRKDKAVEEKLKAILDNADMTTLTEKLAVKQLQEAFNEPIDVKFAKVCCK